MIRRLALPIACAVGLSAWPARAQPPTSEPGLGARVAAHLESARGHTGSGFQNGMAGLRADLLFSPRVSLGGYLGVAGLKGKEGRTRAALGYAQLEYQVPLAPAFGNLRLPLRFGTGYLARNGAVVRASAGLAIRLHRRLDLVTELFAPMFWVTRDQTLFSTNLSLELATSF